MIQLLEMDCLNIKKSKIPKCNYKKYWSQCHKTRK